MVLAISPFIPSLRPVALSRKINLVTGVALNKMSKTKKTYWYHSSIRPSSSCLKVTYRVGTQSKGLVTQKVDKCVHSPWFWCVLASSEATRQRLMITMFEATQPAQDRLMSQSGHLWATHSGRSPCHQIIVNLPHAYLCRGGLFSDIFGGLIFFGICFVIIPINTH